MMTTISIYTYAILTLIIVWFGLNNPRYTKYSGYTLFKSLVFLTIFMLLTDLLHEFLNGNQSTINLIFYPILTIIIYIIPIIMGIIWTAYVYILIHLKSPKIDYRVYAFLIPGIISIILTILSGFFPIYFDFNSQNVYSRALIYPLSLAIQYFYFLFPAILVLKHRKKMHSYKFYPLVLFIIPPAIGGIIQALNYGLLIVWPLLALSILMVFIFVQSQFIKTDYLTGLMNKGAFENHINKIDFIKKNNKLAAILMDLDNFKDINDYYGHSVGDKVLKIFANTCYETFRKDDYLARIGGDEFAVLLYVSDNNQIKKTIDTLTYKLDHINKTNQFEFDISFSYGYKIFDEKSNIPIRSYLNQIDILMYENKKSKVHKKSKI
ncbi:MAG: GGDEF domain-containing protein, partial [Candidatus Izimaplasma sp.]|nr:GGDEF domain-containing protein [Candidatus Izimaplasma bacterium]